MAGHDHHNHARQGRSLVVAIVLNLGFAVAGLFANSPALVADSIHDASDAVALGLSYFGLKMSERAPNQRRTLGCRKVRTLTAFLNSESGPSACEAALPLCCPPLSLHDQLLRQVRLAVRQSDEIDASRH